MMTTAVDQTMTGRQAGPPVTRVRNKRASGVRKSPALHALGFVIVIALVLLIGVPTLFVLVDSIARDPQNFGAGFTLSTLRAVYTSHEVLTSLWETTLVSVVVAVAATAGGAFLAWILMRVDFRRSGPLETLVVFPLFLSPLVGTIAWQSLLAPRSGVINTLLHDGGLDWLTVNIDSVWGIVFVLTINYVPYGFLFSSGVMRNMDSGLEEASYMCGVGIFGTIRRVLVPMLRSGLLSSVLFISILAAGEFSVPAYLGQSTSYTPLAVQIYNAIEGYPSDYPRAGAISTMLILISVVAMYFYRRGIRDSQRFVTVSGRGFGARRLTSSRWMKPLRATFALYVFVAIVLPYAALTLITFTKFRTGDIAHLHFTLAHFQTVFSAPDVVSAIRNTIQVSVVVPVTCVLLGVVVVYCADRLRMPGGGLATYLATVPLAITGVVFGTGVLVGYIRTPLYATIWLIAIGLIAHYLTHSVRILGNGFGQIDRSLEEAAHMNGAAHLRVLRTIDIPLLKPSVVSAFTLIYVFTVREVNATILLYSPTSMVLSVLTWNYLSEGSLQSAAVVGLIQTVLMIVGIAIARFALGIRAIRSVA